jgi:peptidyl-prolyl cis-trans isomerase C
MHGRRGPLLIATTSRFLVGLLLGGLMALAPAAVLAQDAPAAAPEITPDTVVATVGGESITEADIAFAAEDLQQELNQMPPADRKAFLVTVLIDMKVMAKAARDASMNQTDIFKRRLQYLEERALRRAYFTERIAAGVNEQTIQAAYDAFVASFQAVEEVHAKHILVATKEDAEAIKAELATGKAFEVLAMEKSTDPSAKQNGGDLGFFQRGQMVGPFEEAAFAMTEPGQLSEPIETQFGWHVIRFEEKRMSQPPTLEQMAPQLQQQVMFQAFEDTVGTLKKDITIDIPDAELAAGVARQSQGQQQ